MSETMYFQLPQTTSGTYAMSTWFSWSFFRRWTLRFIASRDLHKSRGGCIIYWATLNLVWKNLGTFHAVTTITHFAPFNSFYVECRCKLSSSRKLKIFKLKSISLLFQKYDIIIISDIWLIQQAWLKITIFVIHCPFLLHSFFRREEKREKKNQSWDFKTCISARSYD